MTVSNNNRTVRLPARWSRLNGTSSRRTLRNVATNGRLRNALGFYDGIFVTDGEGNTSNTGIGGVISGFFPNLNWQDLVTNCPLLNLPGPDSGDDTTGGSTGGGDGTAEATGDIVIHFETPAETTHTHTRVPRTTATAARGTPALTAQRATASVARQRVGARALSSRVGATTSHAAAAPASTSTIAAANEPASVINLSTNGSTTASAGFSNNLTTGATVGNSSRSVVPNFSGRRVTQNLVNRRHRSSYFGNGIIYPDHHNNHGQHSGHSGEGGYTEVNWEPYTCYEQQVHYEPVTTYETYYTSEPVTKYRKVYTTVEPAYCDDNIIDYNDCTSCGNGSEWTSGRHHRGHHTGYFDGGEVWIPENPSHHNHRHHGGHSDCTSHHHSDDVWIPELPHHHHGHHSDNSNGCPENHHHTHHHHDEHCNCGCHGNTGNDEGIITEFGSGRRNRGFEHLGDIPSGFKEGL